MLQFNSWPQLANSRPSPEIALPFLRKSASPTCPRFELAEFIEPVELPNQPRAFDIVDYEPEHDD